MQQIIVFNRPFYSDKHYLKSPCGENHVFLCCLFVYVVETMKLAQHNG